MSPSPQVVPKPAREPLSLRPLPRPGQPLQERRSRRSHRCVDALEIALTTAADRAGCDAILIADDKGMVVSHSRTPLDLEMLAAVAPIVARGEAAAKIRRNGRSRALSVTSVDVLGETLHIAALGGRNDQVRLTELARSVAAAERILAA